MSAKATILYSTGVDSEQPGLGCEGRMSGCGEAAGSSKPSCQARERKSQEEIFSGYQALRLEHRQIVTKLSELELDLHEHKLVVDNLEEVEADRQCYRLIGGVLCSKTVKEVLPVLESNKMHLENIIKKLEEKLNNKVQEMNDYKEKYNIRIRGSNDEMAGFKDWKGLRKSVFLF